MQRGSPKLKGWIWRDLCTGCKTRSIRILLAYASHHEMKLYQMDVKSAFLNSFINELVYVDQPPSLKTLDILIMSIGCPRRYMGLSKPQELGISAFGISSLRRASPLGRSIPHYLPRSLMERSSFVKYMLMISYLAHQMKIIPKSLVN